MEAVESGAEIWAFMYVVPVIAVFLVAGLVYFLSFRTKDGASDVSLRMYLNVLSGDDDKNRKAAKRLRKCGSSKQQQKLMQNGKLLESEQADSDLENRSVSAKSGAGFSTADNKPIQVVSRKSDPHENAGSPLTATPALSAEQVDSHLPEDVTDNGGTSLPAAEGDAATQLPVSDGWHVAVSRKERRLNNAAESRLDDTTNHSTTSDESRPSFLGAIKTARTRLSDPDRSSRFHPEERDKNSCSSRSSSPYRHRVTSSTSATHSQSSEQSRKLTATGAVTSTGRRIQHSKTSSTSQLTHQRPDHLKLDSASASSSNSASTSTRPQILLTTPQGEVHASPTKPHTYGECFKPAPVRPQAVDICIQTDENEEFPSPLEGLRRVNSGQPRFIIMMDFSAQVDLDGDEEGLDPFLDSVDKVRCDSGGSFSSGEGSTRLTPVLDDDLSHHYTVPPQIKLSPSPREKLPQGVHRRSVSDFVNPRQSQTYYSYQANLTYQRRRPAPDGSGDAPYFVGRSEPRPYREKPSADWIDNSSRRGVARPTNGRWRN